MPEMSKRMGECSQNGPFLTSLMKPMEEKYMLLRRWDSTTAALVTSDGFGAPLTEPSTGMGSDSDEIGWVSWAEPNMYGMNEWSSSPHTPCEPAGSNVYVRISLRTTLR